MEGMGISKHIHQRRITHAQPSFSQDKTSVVLLLPIQQIFQEVDKGWLIQDTLLSERMEVEGVGKRLHKLQLELEARTVGSPSIRGRLGLGHGGRVQTHTADARGVCLVQRLLANKRPDSDKRRSHMTGATRQYGAWQSSSLLFLVPYHHQLLETCAADMSADEDHSGWQLTESDPGVFTYEIFICGFFSTGDSPNICRELLKTLGVPLVVDDLYSLDSASLAELQPLHALIFLFKWVAGQSNEPSSGGQYDPDFPGFFAHQVVNNACATLAVMNAIANVPGLQMGPQLSELFSFTQGMDPQTSGMAITSSDWLREAHNALSPPSAISLDGLDLPKTSEDAYHFVVYIPYAGSVYELDGLKQAPVRHGEYAESGEGWVAKAR